MAKERKKKEKTTEDLLVDLLIVQLRIAGLTQNQIRETVGVDVNRVSRLIKHIKPNTKKDDK